MSIPLSPPIGWPLLPLPDERGELAYPTLEESVRQSIRVLLSTRPGEQLLRPAFGAGLANFLHEPNTPGTQRRIRDAIGEALERHELRVAVERIEVLDVPDEPTHLRVEIAYRLRRTGAAQALGLTLLLEA